MCGCERYVAWHCKICSNPYARFCITTTKKKEKEKRKQISEVNLLSLQYSLLKGFVWLYVFRAMPAGRQALMCGLGVNVSVGNLDMKFCDMPGRTEGTDLVQKPQVLLGWDTCEGECCVSHPRSTLGTQLPSASSCPACLQCTQELNQGERGSRIRSVAPSWNFRACLVTLFQKRQGNFDSQMR